MKTVNESEGYTQKSHLFMVRFWLEDLGNGKTDWRGKVQHVNSGEVRYFRDWLALEKIVTEFLGRQSGKVYPVNE